MRSTLDRIGWFALMCVAAGIFLFVDTSPVFAQGGEPQYFAIRGARVVPVSGPPVDDATVVVARGVILSVGKDASIPADAWVIEGKGMTVYPGLVDALTEARLMVKSRDTRGAPTVEVAHEALFTHWPRLAAWSQRAGDDLRVLRQVALAAVEWERQGRKEALQRLSQQCYGQPHQCSGGCFSGNAAHHGSGVLPGNGAVPCARHAAHLTAPVRIRPRLSRFHQRL